jgi:hypothetical protein
VSATVALKVVVRNPFIFDGIRRHRWEVLDVLVLAAKHLIETNKARVIRLSGSIR